MKKVTGAVTTVMVYNAMGQLVAEYDNVNTLPLNAVKYVTADHLGSTRVVTDASGAVKARYDYLPYGEELASSTGSRSSVEGYQSSESIRQKFTSRERDNESGLDYFLARYYSSAQGRFTSADDFFKDSQSADPQSWNKYVYCRNNPLKYIDPEGEKATVTIETDKKNKTGTIKINASFAIYAPDDRISEADLQKQAGLLKTQIESVWSGSFTAENGITYNVSTNVTVQVFSEQQAEELGNQGKVDNLVAITNQTTLNYFLNGKVRENALAITYMNGEKFDRMTVAGRRYSALANYLVYGHEFGHALGINAHFDDGTIMAEKSGSATLTRQDGNAAFGQAINAHMRTRNQYNRLVHHRGGPSIVKEYGPPKPTTHTLRSAANLSRQF